MGDRFFVQRITALAASADRISRGDLDARTGMAHAGDEINGSGLNDPDLPIIP
jgi:hypothetical protein